MVGNVTIQGQITGTATFDGAKISAVVTIAPCINATVVFGRSGVTVHNLLTGRDDKDAHPIEAISDPAGDSSKIYGWIRSTLLTGLVSFTDASIAAGDAILAAFSKLQGQINAMKSRVGLLEDSYLLKYIVPADVVSINLTTDKYGRAFNFVDGDSIEVIIAIPRFTGDGVNRPNIRVNNISNNVYVQSVAFNAITTGGSSYYNNFSTTRINIVGDELVGYVNTHLKINQTPAYASQLIGYYTDNINIQNISSIDIVLSNSTYLIPAGSIIMIKKIR